MFVIIVYAINLIPISIFGLVKLSSIIARVEDRLQMLVYGYNETCVQNGSEYLSLKFNSMITKHISWTTKLFLPVFLTPNLNELGGQLECLL